MTGYVNFTCEDLASLKEALAAAKQGKLDTDKFVWREHELLIRYAEYLVEYLEQRFKEGGDG